MKFLFIFTLFISLLFAPLTVIADEVETRYGAGLTYGQSYDPSEETLDWVQAYWTVIFDYDAIWPHRAPEPLRFKVDAHAGATVRPDVRAIISANIFAQYYLGWLSTNSLKPYMEAGIGLIYTDFQVEGQGLRFNFNPQLGIGTDYRFANGSTWFGNLRAHHISNGNLHEDNRGINSVTFTLGRYF